MAGAALPVGAANLGDPHPGSAQGPAQPRPVVADTLDPHHLELTQALRPGQEVAVTDAGGGHRVAAQGPAELIGGVRDMKMLVSIDGARGAARATSAGRRSPEESMRRGER